MTYRMWMITSSPAFLMLLSLIIFPHTWKTLTPYTAYFSLFFLILVLSLNPFHRLKPNGITRYLNKHRQEIGVASFFYAALHFLCFIIKRGSVEKAFSYFLHPALMPGFIALAVFLLLALTSNKFSQKKMGFPAWKNLHKKVYWAQGLIIIHMIMVGEKRFALLLFTPLILLQMFSFFKARSKRRF